MDSNQFPDQPTYYSDTKLFSWVRSNSNYQRTTWLHTRKELLKSPNFALINCVCVFPLFLMVYYDVGGFGSIRRYPGYTTGLYEPSCQTQETHIFKMGWGHFSKHWHWPSDYLPHWCNLPTAISPKRLKATSWLINCPFSSFSFPSPCPIFWIFGFSQWNSMSRGRLIKEKWTHESSKHCNYQKPIIETIRSLKHWNSRSLK